MLRCTTLCCVITSLSTLAFSAVAEDNIVLKKPSNSYEINEMSVPVPFAFEEYFTAENGEEGPWIPFIGQQQVILTAQNNATVGQLGVDVYQSTNGTCTNFYAGFATIPVVSTNISGSPTTYHSTNASNFALDAKIKLISGSVVSLSNDFTFSFYNTSGGFIPFSTSGCLNGSLVTCTGPTDCGWSVQQNWNWNN